MIDHFHEYLYGGTFDVYTDNNPLTYILTSVKHDVIGQCWVASLANFNFKLHYKTGKANVESNALSHIPWDREDCEMLDTHAIKAIMAGCSCNAALFEPFVGYGSVAHNIPVSQTWAFL